MIFSKADLLERGIIIDFTVLIIDRPGYQFTNFKPKQNPKKQFENI